MGELLVPCKLRIHFTKAVTDTLWMLFYSFILLGS